MQQLIALGPGKLEWREIAPPKLVRRPMRWFAQSLFRFVTQMFRSCVGNCLRARRSASATNSSPISHVGEDVAGFVPGDRVVVSFLIACGTCKRCRQGYPAACLSVPPNRLTVLAYLAIGAGRRATLFGSRTQPQ